MLVRIGLLDFSFCIDGIDGEVTRSVEVQVRVHGVGVEAIDRRCMFLRDMAVAGDFADNSTIFRFCEGIIVGVPRARAGELHAQFLQHLSDVMVDVLGA